MSDLVVINGKAAEELRITSNGYCYDWFFIPEGCDKTFSEFEGDEYLDFASQVLWPISEKIKKFLIENVSLIQNPPEWKL